MALYISLSLLAVLVALPPDEDTAGEMAATIALTSAGLMFAHLVAFRMSTRYLHGRLDAAAMSEMGAQLAGGGAVTVLAVLPALFFEPTAAVIAAQYLLIGFIAAVGYVSVRSIPASRTRAIIYTAGVVALTLAVVAVKTLAH